MLCGHPLPVCITEFYCSSASYCDKFSGGLSRSVVVATLCNIPLKYRLVYIKHGFYSFYCTHSYILIVSLLDTKINYVRIHITYKLFIFLSKVILYRMKGDYKTYRKALFVGCFLLLFF